MTTSDHPGDGTAGGGQHERHRPGHTRPEGEYQDRDVAPGYGEADRGADGSADGGADRGADGGADGAADRGADGDVEPVGSYVDTDVTATQQLRPEDEGEFTDHDVVDEHRHVPEEGSYVDIDAPPDVTGTGAADRGADHGADGAADRGADHGADRSADHGADGGADRGADHGAGGGADRGADRGADHGADGGADRGADHGADGGADRGADAGADHGADTGATYPDDRPSSRPERSPDA
jgi:hypothetical protein